MTITTLKDKPIKNPVCDNCKKPITGVSRYIWRDGETLLVHYRYNEKTRKCKITNE